MTKGIPMEDGALAFGLTVGAGMCTCLGAAVVFSPRLVSLANKKFLASSLAGAAGVMIYVSFVEIFQKSLGGFEDAGYPYEEAYVLATVCFFAGILLGKFFNWLAHWVGGGGEVGHGEVNLDTMAAELAHTRACEDDNYALAHEGGFEVELKKVPSEGAVSTAVDTLSNSSSSNSSSSSSSSSIGSSSSGSHSNCSPLSSPSSGSSGGSDEKKEGDGQDSKASYFPCPFDPEHGMEDAENDDDKTCSSSKPLERPQALATAATTAATAKSAATSTTSGPRGDAAAITASTAAPTSTAAAAAAAAAEAKTAEEMRLVHMGTQTALAIGIHNFPEGLATFVGTLADPRVGIGLAIAIGIHNVPEGLCVSVPIYYATKDRWSAFKWAFISGISEPIGAALGWLILAQVMDDLAYGIVFGLVGGMMVNICVKELLPTAFRYDPKDSLVTNSFVVGMAIMAASLVLFVAL